MVSPKPTNLSHSFNNTQGQHVLYKIIEPTGHVPRRCSQLSAAEAHWEGLFFGQLHSKSSTENLESLGI